MLTLAIIISSIVVGGTTVTVASLSFAKWITEREDRLDGNEAPKSRMDTLPVIEGVAEVRKCPMCGWDCSKNKKVMLGSWFKEKKEENKFSQIQAHAEHSSMVGATSGVTVQTADGYKLYQGCTRCGGEWLVQSSVVKPILKASET